MARKCDSKGFVVRTDQISKLKDEDIILVNIRDQLVSCAKVDARNITKNLTGMDNTTSIYNAANVPTDAFGCSKNACYNTGTFQGPVTTAGVGADNSVIIGDFRKTFDAALYTAGLVTVYVLLPDGDHNVSFEIAAYTEQNYTNSNTITRVVHATKGNGGSYLYPVEFYLGDLSNIKGTGWVGNSVGATFRILIDGTNLKADDLVGVSSFAFYESVDDLQLNQTIIFKCIDTWGDNQSLDVVEGQCSQSEYNSASGTITFNMTVNQWTKNFRALNPTWYETEEIEAGIPRVVTRTVKQGEGELANFGTIQLSDMKEGTCGSLYIQTPGCANNSSALTQISSPVPVEMNAGNFQVLTSDYNGIENQGTILVDKQWVGQELNIIYLQSHTARISQITNEFRDFNCSIIAPLRKKDNSLEYHYYENAFLTTDVNAISRSDETSKELQFTVAADENGVRKQIIEPLD